MQYVTLPVEVIYKDILMWHRDNAEAHWNDLDADFFLWNVVFRQTSIAFLKD